MEKILKYHQLQILHGPALIDLNRAFLKANKKRRPIIYLTVNSEPGHMDLYVDGLIYTDKNFLKIMVIGEVKNVQFLEEWGLSSSKIKFLFDVETRRGRFLEEKSNSVKK